MASVPKYIVYILHHSIHENAIIDWARIISNEISFQLGSLRKTKKFYMTSYLVFVIVYCHIFEDFPRVRNVDFKKEPVSFWYPVLWRHKAPYNFYEVQNGFLSSFKKMIHGPTTSRLSLEVASFLSEKGFFEALEEFSFLRLVWIPGETLFITILCF
jgi:hypothetical protein